MPQVDKNRLAVLLDEKFVQCTLHCIGQGLGTSSLQIGDKIVSVLLLLQTSEDHLSTRDVLLRVLKVNIKSVYIPGDAFVLVSLRVGEASSLSGFPAKHSVKIGPLLVLATGLHSVTLGTGLGEDLLAVIRAHIALNIETSIYLESYQTFKYVMAIEKHLVTNHERVSKC